MLRLTVSACCLASLLSSVPVVVSAELGKDWTQVTSGAAWTPRCMHGCTSYDRRIWVIGGEGANAIWEVWYSSDGSKWTLATERVPWRGRKGAPVVLHSGKMWLLGGSDYLCRNDVWYSSDGVKWTSATLNASWAPRRYHASVAYDGKIWVLGGTAPSAPWPGYVNDVWYSSDGVKWTSATLSAAWAADDWLQSVVHDGKIWVIKSDVWYSTNGTSWTCATARPPWKAVLWGDSVRDMKAVVCGGKIWVMGGATPYGITTRAVCYSSDGANWRVATSPVPWPGRVGFGLVLHDRKMWVLGGYTPGVKGSQGKLLNDVWYSAMPTAVHPWRLYP